MHIPPLIARESRELLREPHVDHVILRIHSGDLNFFNTALRFCLEAVDKALDIFLQSLPSILEKPLRISENVSPHFYRVALQPDEHFCDSAAGLLLIFSQQRS